VVAEGDAIARRATRPLQAVAALSVASLVVSLVPWLRRGDLPLSQTAGSLTAGALGLLALVLLQRGRFRAGVLAIAFAVWAHVVWPMITLGLQHVLVGTRFAVLPLVLVALLLGRREVWLLFFAFAAAASVGAARDAGWLGGAGPQPTLLPEQPLFSTLVLFLVVALLVDRLAGALREALADAVRGNQALRERDQMREELRQAQKMEALGRLAGGVTHDFNNVLTAILGTASVAAEELPAGHPVRADLEQIAADAGRATELTRRLLTFARKEPVSPRLIPFDEHVTSAAGLLRRTLGAKVRLELALGAPGAHVLLDPAQLDQLLLNLGVNARDAMPKGGRVWIATRVAPARAAGRGEEVVLTVADEGQGIPADVLPRVFEPFFTTKAPGEGTGIGLATCHGIAAQAGGEIRVESEPGSGTRFEVRLPRAGDLQRAPPAGGEAPRRVLDRA